MSKGWFRERHRHRLAAYGIPSKTEVRTPVKEPDLSPLSGGLAEGQKPERYDEEQLRKGTEIEMEHTNNPYIARRIAMDHLSEHDDYYKHLSKMEHRLEKKQIRHEKKLKRREERLKQKKRRK